MLTKAEECAQFPESELNDFIQQLVPAESAKIAHSIWNQNYVQFESELSDAYTTKMAAADAYYQNLTRIKTAIESLIRRIVLGIQQMLRLVTFGTRVVLLSNFFFWKQSALAVTGLASKFIPSLY